MTELDIEQPAALVAYLREAGWVAPGEEPAVRVLAGGVSNKTVLVRRRSGEAWVLKQALPKLRVAVDWFSDPARIEREALGMEWLAKLAPPGTIPRLVFFDRERHLLAMEAVPEPHENWKAMLMAGRVDIGLVEQFGRLLGVIHREGAERRLDLAAVFEDRAFFESLRVEPYYLYTAGRIPAAAKFYATLVGHTRDRRVSLVHGDYSPKNVLVRDGRLVLLDHEVIHWGDPSFDLGFALAHLLSKAHHLPAHRAAFAAAADRFYTAYVSEFSAIDLLAPAQDVRHALGCLLARVAGRSPLEYLSAAERERQAEVVLRLMNRPPPQVWELIRAFVEAL